MTRACRYCSLFCWTMEFSSDQRIGVKSQSNSHTIALITDIFGDIPSSPGELAAPHVHGRLSSLWDKCHSWDLTESFKLKLQVKKRGPHCVFSITVCLLHQSTCFGKELTKKSLTSSGSGMISRSSSPGNLFPVTLEIWTEFISAFLVYYANEPLLVWIFGVLFPPFYLSIHLFIQ